MVISASGHFTFKYFNRYLLRFGLTGYLILLIKTNNWTLNYL